MRAHNVSTGQLRLISRIAGMYYIVRISVGAPEGIFFELERAIEKKFDLREVVVADCGEDGRSSLFKALGEAAASWLDARVGAHEVVVERNALRGGGHSGSVSVGNPATRRVVGLIFRRERLI